MSPLPRALARTNKLVLNRVMRHVVPHLPGFALLTHVGRSSGRSYTIPLIVFDEGEEVRIALTYGSATDWVRNVRASGRCVIERDGQPTELVEPRLEHDPAVAWAPPVTRRILRLTRVPESLLLRRTGTAPPSPPTVDGRASDH